MANLDELNQKLDDLLGIALGNQAVLSVLATREAIRDAWERGTEVTEAEAQIMREVLEAREILDVKPGQAPEQGARPAPPASC